MALSRTTLRYWQFVLRRVWSDSLATIAGRLIRAMAGGEFLDRAVYIQILDDLEKKSRKAIENIANIEAKKFVVLKEKNLQPLTAFIDERMQRIKKNIASYQSLLDSQGATFARFGRRNQDIIRELGVNSVERGILSGSIPKARKELYEELLKNTPVVDGRFSLEVFPYEGKYRSFNVKHYADLVAQTTRTEAQNVANADIKAAQLGTRLVKFNETGKDYYSLKDPCAAIDGKAYSTEPGGTLIDGKFFPYWRDAIRGGFATPHPFCQHRLRPVSEDLASQLTPGLTFSQYQQRTAA